MATQVVMKNRRNRARRGARADGFTLLELLVVLLILGLLATIATPQVLGYLGGAKTDTARIQISNISAALDLHRLDVGRYPSKEEGLVSLVRRPADAERWNGPYLRKEQGLTDPWGNPYVYVFPGAHGDYDLSSFGADGAAGGEGENQDVTSW